MNLPQQSDSQHTGMMNVALKFINSTGRHIFLTGKAGTGKTTFLKSLSLHTHKQAAIVAPTGIAALNAGGTTIHSQFLLPFGMFIPDRSYAEPPADGANWYTETVLAKRHPLNSVRKQVLRAIDLLIIDEVSMLRADLLDAIDYRLRSIRGNFRQGFGGVQLLLIGDLYQLPPVVKREEESRLNKYYKSPWFFESKGLQRDGFTYIELDKIFRQRDDAFIRILNNLRVNTPMKEDLIALNKYYLPPEEIQNTDEVITLTTHNYMADKMNLKALQELQSPSLFFNATIENDFPESMYPVLASLELKEGAQLMFTRNDSEEGAYYNGKLATVTSISGDNIIVSMSGSSKPYTLKRSLWENKKYRLNDTTKELEDDVVGTFSQFPVRLAWAITVHKSQGLTFDKAIIDVGQAFADGQVYVALSRLRSIDGLILRTKVDSRIVSTDKQIVSFDQANNHPDILDTEIKTQQREFILRQGNKTFDFDPLVKEIAYVVKNDEAKPRFEEKTMKPILKQIGDALSAENGNTIKFRAQLKELLEAGKHEELLLRIGKGTDYYKKLLWEQVKTLLQHLEEMRSEKRVKGYLNNLRDIDQLLSKKLEEVDKMFYIAEGITRDNHHFDFGTLTAERTKLRLSLLQEIGKHIKHVPSRKKGKKKKGTNEPNTIDISIEMAERGIAVEDIAKERNLVRGTIEGHLAKGIESGRISIFKFMSRDDVETITASLEEMSEAFTSGELFNKLNGRFSHGQLRAVMFHTGIRSFSMKDLNSIKSE